MSNKTKVLWLIGSNCSGKTTQSKLFHSAVNFGHYKPTIVTMPFIDSNKELNHTSYTLFDNSLHVGALKDNQCTGTDSLSTKDQIEMAYLSGSNANKKYIVIDGIMATFSWCEMIKQIDVETYCTLLHFDNEEDNFTRAQQRRWKKKHGALSNFDKYDELNDNTKKNIRGKIKGFYNMWGKISTEFDYSTIISATLSEEEIHKQILKFISS